MFQTEVVHKIKIFFASYILYENRVAYELRCKNMVEPGGTHDNIIRRMRFSYRITKARIQAHSHNNLILLSHGSSSYANAPLCTLYVHCLSCCLLFVYFSYIPVLSL